MKIQIRVRSAQCRSHERYRPHRDAARGEATPLVVGTLPQETGTRQPALLSAAAATGNRGRCCGANEAQAAQARVSPTERPDEIASISIRN